MAILLNKLFFLFVVLASSSFAQSFDDYRSFLIKYEGYRTKPYRDNAKWAVGIGHNLSGDEPIRNYTKEEVEELFARDLARAQDICAKIYAGFEQFSPNVKLVLVSLAFNLGETGLRKFIKFNGYVNQMDWENAAKELEDSKWYGQVGKRGREHKNQIKKG